MDDCLINFPEDIVTEILLRCPVKSLLRFKCVRKKWYVLIKTPEFIQQHLKCSKNKPPQLLLYNVGNLVDNQCDSRSLTLISKENPQTFKDMTYLLGSVDDLFFMFRVIDDVISCALWNPATREVKPLHLPAPIIDGRPEFGFGLDLFSNDYKVVNFHYNYLSEYSGAVYSCSKDSWRIFKPKELLPISTNVKPTFGTAYLNGAYYWLLKRGHRCYHTILSFDFGSEIFEQIEGLDGHSANTFALGLMLLDDSIAILSYSPGSMFDYDIWIMIQLGVWNKIVTFECFKQIKSCYDSSLILVTKASQLVSYNVRTDKTRHLGFQHSCLRRHVRFSGYGVFYYKESLVTIKQRDDEE